MKVKLLFFALLALASSACAIQDEPEMLGSRASNGMGDERLKGSYNSAAEDVENYFAVINEYMGFSAVEGQSNAMILGKALKSKSEEELEDMLQVCIKANPDVDNSARDYKGDFLERYADLTSMEEAVEMSKFLESYITMPPEDKANYFYLFTADKELSIQLDYARFASAMDNGLLVFLEGYSDEISVHTWVLSHRCALMLACELGFQILSDVFIEGETGGVGTPVVIADSMVGVAESLLNYHDCERNN